MEIIGQELGDRVFPAGKIEKGAVANPAAHTYDVRATLDNAAGELLPGMVCRVTVSPAESAEEIAVPVRAVQQAGDGTVSCGPCAAIRPCVRPSRRGGW